MPSVIPSADVESLSEGRDTDVVMSKARMHLRILHAELEYLAEQNVQFENPEFQRLASLIAEKFLGNAVDNESAQSPETADVKELEVLPVPQMFLVNKLYTGKTHEFLTARPGDLIIVHAWIQGNQAMGYNEANDSFGRIPSTFLRTKGSEPKDLYDTFILPQEFRGPPNSAFFLPWKSGDRIRVCKWEDGCKIRGIGFNLAKGQIGAFSMSCHPQRETFKRDTKLKFEFWDVVRLIDFNRVESH